MAFIKSALDKFIAELKKATPEQKQAISELLGDTTVSASGTKEEGVANETANETVGEKIPEPAQPSGEDQETELASEEEEVAEETPAEEETSNTVENNASDEIAENEAETQEANSEEIEAEESAAEENTENDDSGSETFSESETDNSFADDTDDIVMRKDDGFGGYEEEKEQEMPADYEAIIDGLNAKILALQTENNKLKAKTEGAFGYSSKIMDGAKPNRLFDDCSDIKIHK